MPFNAVNPALMWGASLISVPIIIHLLNRRRFRIIDWAAMEWLLQAIKQNKRRITIEQLILLALRCLIVLLVVLAVSQLRFSGSAGLAGGLLDQRTDWVVVLDDSFTMGQSTSSVTCFDRARKETVELLRRLADTDAKDYFAIMLGREGRHELPAVPQTDRKAVQTVESKLEHIQPSDLKHPPAELLVRGVEALRRTPNAAKSLVLATDCRQSDWRLTEADRKALKEAVDQARELGIKTYLVDVGPQDPNDYANLAVTKLAGEEKAVPVGEVARFTATVRNFGPRAVSGVPVKFTFGSPADGENPLATRTIETVPAGGEVTVTEYYSFKRAGAYSVGADIATDALPADNARYLALRVTEGIDVLLVDGEPGLEPAAAESFALARALRPDRATPSGINPRVVDADALKGTDIDRASVIFLLNVPRLSEANLKSLTDFVRRGGGLAIFTGDQVDPAVFNELFYAEGKGLVPCRLTRAVGKPSPAELGDEEFVSLSSDHLDHPLMAGFRDVSFLVPAARFYRRFELDLPKDPRAAGVGVVANYGDENRTPAIVEKAFDKGKVVLVTSSADTEWNTWMREMTYPVMMNLLVEYLYTPSSGAQNIPVGAKYVKPVNLELYEPSASIEPPRRGGALRRAAQQDERGEAVVTFGEMDLAGIYTVRLQPRQEAAARAAGASIEYFAANLDTSKSDLRRAEPQVLRTELANIGITYGASVEDIWKATADEGANLWSAILVALGCCLALESVLGWVFGHHAKH